MGFEEAAIDDGAGRHRRVVPANIPAGMSDYQVQIPYACNALLSQKLYVDSYRGMLT